MTTYTIRKWRAFPQISFGAWFRDLFGLSVPEDRVTRITPVASETPATTIQRFRDKGFRPCTDLMVDDTLNTVSRHPGFVIFPMTDGRRRVLRVEASGQISEVEESTFKFFNHASSWTVAMVRPPKRKPKA